MSSFLYPIGHTMFRRRRRVLAFWLAALAAMIALAASFGGSTSDRFTIPGTESQEAIDLLEARFPAQSGSDARVVFAAAEGGTLIDAANRAAILATIDEIARGAEVLGVTDPYAAGTMSPDGTIAFADVHYGGQPSEVSEAA